MTYTIVSGDTLTSIAKKFNTTVKKLQELNPTLIKDVNKICAGWVIKVSGEAEAAPVTKNNKAIVTKPAILTNSRRQVYSTWEWSKHDETDHYEVRWSYSWGVGIEEISESPTKYQYSQYTPPDHATHVTIVVTPIAKTKKVKQGDAEVDVPLWEASPSDRMTFWYTSLAPEVPPRPSVSITGNTLTATLSDLDLEGAESIKFQILREGIMDPVYHESDWVPIVQNRVSYSCTVADGSNYVVRCKAKGRNGESDWSDGYSDVAETRPNAPKGITSCKALSKTSVQIEWDASEGATGYDVEQTTDESYFDTGGSTSSKSVEGTVCIFDGLESGKKHFFRVRATKGSLVSEWSPSTSVIIGTKPAAPTTWSSTTTAIVGEPLTLYWMHNTEDGSSETYAQIKLTVDGKSTTKTQKKSEKEDEKDKVGFYEVDTTAYPVGTKLQWQVRTRGITEDYSDWSVQRTVDIYAQPTLTLYAKDSSGASISKLKMFPINIEGIAGPNTQTPIGYHLTIVANETYETRDRIGRYTTVQKNEIVYSKYFDIDTKLETAITASDVDLENNISYTINCVVSMNSGLTAEASRQFSVNWSDDIYAPNAEIGINTDTYQAIIGPYCDDENGKIIPDILMSVYRREFDGGFTEIIRDVPNAKGSYVTDPHPPLDYARYRIVAMTQSTGAMSFYDTPAHPVGGKAVIIQWDEQWQGFDVAAETGAVSDISWTGSMLKLPYNIDVSNSHAPDVELIEYIGRAHPVSYYGTQVGETASWKVDIPADDKDTLYALRRLAKWMGDVYVREPSGSGYWANIKVSFSQTHREVIIPVNLEITRVEGGV